MRRLVKASCRELAALWLAAFLPFSPMLAEAQVQLNGKVGPNPLSDGASGPLRQTKDGSLGVQDTHARYQEAVLRGNVFTAELQSVATFGTSLTSTMVTFMLYNPPNSGKALVILEGTATGVTCGTAGSVVYAVSTNTATTPPVAVTALANMPRNALIGAANAASVANVYTAATLSATPLAVRTMFGCGSAAGNMTFVDPVDGKLAILPGNGVAVEGITVVGTGLIGMMWEEVNYP